DGHVVRLLHDEREVVVQHRDGQEGDSEEADDGGRPRPTAPAVEEGPQEEDRAHGDEDLRGGQRVDDVLDLVDHSGPEMPPSLRTRQKWTAMRMPATSGMP